MKTYFLAWESDNKRGHAIWDFKEDGQGGEIMPREALSRMLASVNKEMPESVGVVSAIQFNRVD